MYDMLVRECASRAELKDLADKSVGYVGATAGQHETLANKHRLSPEERLALVKTFNNDVLTDELLVKLHKEVQVTNPHNSWLYTKIFALEFPGEVTEMRLSQTLLEKKFEKVDETYQS